MYFARKIHACDTGAIRKIHVCDTQNARALYAKMYACRTRVTRKVHTAEGTHRPGYAEFIITKYRPRAFQARSIHHIPVFSLCLTAAPPRAFIFGLCTNGGPADYSKYCKSCALPLDASLLIKKIIVIITKMCLKTCSRCTPIGFKRGINYKISPGPRTPQIPVPFAESLWLSVYAFGDL